MPLQRKGLHTLPAGDLPTHDAARRFWSSRAHSELAAVPAMAQLTLALVRAGASMETLATTTSIAADEARHALLSRELAARLGGYVDDLPEDLPYQSLAAPSQVPVHVWALAAGCFSETVSLALIRARARVTTQPLVRAVLVETLKDEALHVQVGWALAEELLPKLSQADHRNLLAYGDALAAGLRRSFGTLDLPPSVAREARALRDQTADAGLGALSADEENALIEQTLEQIDERLAALSPTK